MFLEPGDAFSLIPTVNPPFEHEVLRRLACLVPDDNTGHPCKIGRRIVFVTRNGSVVTISDPSN